MAELNQTPSRLALLRDVARGWVWQHPDGTSHLAGGRQVTSKIARLEGAGWVRLGEGRSDNDVRYWELTDTGRAALMAHGGQ